MASRKRSIVNDPDNPEWTAEDFAKARPAEEILPGDVLRAFKGRGPQKEPKKVAVSLRLDTFVVKEFKSTGRGWQSRINGALMKVMKTGKVSKADIISLGPKPIRNVRGLPPKKTARTHAAKRA